MIIDSTIMSSLVVALTAIFLDMILGVLISIMDKTFDFSILPRFLATNVMPYAGGLIILALFASYVSEWEYVYYTGVGLVAVKFTKEALIEKLRILMP